MKGTGKPGSNTEIANARPESRGFEISTDPHNGHFISAFLLIGNEN